MTRRRQLLARRAARRASSPAAPPVLGAGTGLEAELARLFEARDVLEDMAASLERSDAVAQADRVSVLAREVAAGGCGPDAVAQRMRAIDEGDRRERERREAVQFALDRIRGQLGARKRSHPEDAARWIERRIASLLLEETGQQRQTRATAARVKALQDELDALRGRGGSAGSEAAPKRIGRRPGSDKP